MDMFGLYNIKREYKNIKYALSIANQLQVCWSQIYFIISNYLAGIITNDLIKCNHNIDNKILK